MHICGPRLPFGLSICHCLSTKYTKDRETTQS